MDTFFNTLPCPAIQQLSVTVQDQGGLVYLCGRMPNLTDLRITFCDRDYEDDDDDPIVSNSFSTSMIDSPSYLTKLHLDFYADQLSLKTLEWLLGSCQKHLKECTINAENCDYINGAQLERLLKPCGQLVKLAFKIEIESGDGDHTVDVRSILREYRTDWWRDASRPPVFMKYTADRGIEILSLPNSSMKSIRLSTDPKLWRLNWIPCNSPEFVFTKVTSIHLLDKNRMPISLELLQLLDSMFPAAGQSLTCDYWEFASPQTIYDSVSNDIPKIVQKMLEWSLCDSFSGTMGWCRFHNCRVWQNSSLLTRTVLKWPASLWLCGSWSHRISSSCM